MFEKILVAVDGSMNSDRAVEAAAEMARVHGATLSICHAFHIPEQYKTDLADELEEALESDAEKILSHAAGVAERAGVAGDDQAPEEGTPHRGDSRLRRRGEGRSYRGRREGEDSQPVASNGKRQRGGERAGELLRVAGQRIAFGGRAVGARRAPGVTEEATEGPRRWPRVRTETRRPRAGHERTAMPWLDGAGPRRVLSARGAALRHLRARE